jgi:hypothetical protein
VGGERAAAEGQDVICGFGPSERLGRGISAFDVGGDRVLQLGDGSMRAALDLLFGQEREEALDRNSMTSDDRHPCACIAVSHGWIIAPVMSFEHLIDGLADQM